MYVNVTYTWILSERREPKLSQQKSSDNFIIEFKRKKLEIPAPTHFLTTISLLKKKTI